VEERNGRSGQGEWSAPRVLREEKTRDRTGIGKEFLKAPF